MAVTYAEVGDKIQRVGKSDVTLTVEPSDQPDIIAFTVPSELPIIMKTSGEIGVPTNAAIINHVVPKNLTDLGDDTFKGCSSIETVEIPNGVTLLGTETFMDCKSLKNVKLPSKLRTIQYAVFKNCTSLKYIDIPASVTQIYNPDSTVREYKAFDGCSNITINLYCPKTSLTSGSPWGATNATINWLG